MSYDFKTNDWRHDINAFGRWKNMMQTIAEKDGPFYDKLRERIRSWMTDIQQRWPQYIKNDEIP